MLVRMTEASETLKTTPTGRGLVILLGNLCRHQTELPTEKASHEEGKVTRSVQADGSRPARCSRRVIARKRGVGDDVGQISPDQTWFAPVF